MSVDLRIDAFFKEGVSVLGEAIVLKEIAHLFTSRAYAGELTIKECVA